MTMTNCQRCNATTTDSQLCLNCIRTLVALSPEARAISRLLADQRSRATQLRTSTVEPAAPISLDALVLRNEIDHALTWLPVIYAPEAPRAYMRLEGLVHKGRDILDGPPERIIVDHCYVEGCPGEYAANVGSDWAVCNACGHTRNDAIDMAANRLADVYKTEVNLKRACDLLNRVGVKISYATARKWVERGKITRNERGLVAIGDVLAVARTQAANRS